MREETVKTNLAILTEKTKGLFRRKQEPVSEKVGKALVTQLTTIILVTGTIGKTSTMDLMIHMLKQNQLKSLSNDMESNDRQGIIQSLVRQSDFRGKLPGTIGIFEVEKESLHDVLQYLTPHLIVVTNFYEREFSHWFDALEPILKKTHTHLLANAEEPFTNMLQELKKEIKTFSVQGNVSFVDYQVMDLQVEEEIQFTLNEQPLHVQSKSIHVVYNTVAAIAALSMLKPVLHLHEERLYASISHQKLPANGRMEFYQLAQQSLMTSVWNNSIGAEMVLNHIEKDSSTKQLIFFFSNQDPDLMDTSWVWEVNMERIDFSLVSRIICTGKKAHEMALRLKYAGVENEKMMVIDSVAQALDEIQNKKDTTYLLPSYTYLNTVVERIKNLS